MQVTGKLPVPITVLVGQKTIKCREVIVKQITVAQSLEAQSQLKANQYVLLAEMVAMTTLVDEESNQHSLTYDALASTSRQNLHALQSLVAEVDVKELAESVS